MNLIRRILYGLMSIVCGAGSYFLLDWVSKILGSKLTNLTWLQGITYLLLMLLFTVAGCFGLLLTVATLIGMITGSGD